VTGNSLLFKKFRISGCYALKEWHQAAPDVKRTLSGLAEESEIYGIFEPTDLHSTLSIKVAYLEVALIYLHLLGNDQLPHYLALAPGEKTHTTITQLVLDHILEIEYDQSFVGGRAALKWIYRDHSYNFPDQGNHIAKISLQSIHYAYCINITDIKILAAKIYTAHTYPMDSRKRLAFLAAQSIIQFLVPAADKELDYLLTENWLAGNNGANPAWLIWHSKKNKRSYLTSNDKPQLKLYISPRHEDFPAVFKKSLTILSATSAFSFKTGATIAGLLRPDKMVVYFENEPDLHFAASLLKPVLREFDAQGVPFSCQLDEKGLLSWGMDPPGKSSNNYPDGSSWRYRISYQLAVAIIEAKIEGLTLSECLPFLKYKLENIGVDMKSWSPLQENNYHIH
jgi:hypothetical protein